MNTDHEMSFYILAYKMPGNTYNIYNSMYLNLIEYLGGTEWNVSKKILSVTSYLNIIYFKIGFGYFN